MANDRHSIDREVYRRILSDHYDPISDIQFNQRSKFTIEVCSDL